MTGHPHGREPNQLTESQQTEILANVMSGWALEVAVSSALGLPGPNPCCRNCLIDVLRAAPFEFRELLAIAQRERSYQYDSEDAFVEDVDDSRKETDT
jgi:hypothetical protein